MRRKCWSRRTHRRSFHSDNRFKTCLGLCFGKEEVVKWKSSATERIITRRRAKLYHMLSFTFHDCIFLMRGKTNKEEASKNHQTYKESGRRRTFFREICSCSMDEGLFSHGFGVIYGNYTRARCDIGCAGEPEKHESIRRSQRNRFKRVESSCSWIIDYESHIFRGTNRKKPFASCTSVFECSTFFSCSLSVWMVFCLLQKNFDGVADDFNTKFSQRLSETLWRWC